MEISTLPFPFANAMDVKNQVLFLMILASFTNGKLANADLHNIASQIKVTHYDCGEMTENNLYALNQDSNCNIAPENLEVSRAKITIYTKHFRREIKATVCRVRVDNGTVALETTQAWTPQTPVLIIIAQCIVRTLTAITSSFNSTHMVWTLPLGITLQLCLPYSQTTTMVY